MLFITYFFPVPTLQISKAQKKQEFEYFERLDFQYIQEIATRFAEHIKRNFDEISQILLRYESLEVVNDETNRTLDLLTNLQENRNFFKKRAGSVTSFLPRNQPLYSLSCFVAIPALMTTDVHLRPPHCMRHFFSDLIRSLKFSTFFQNVFISETERLSFLRDRTAIMVEPNGNKHSITQTVIFTGSKDNADRLRKAFDPSVLFIANGSGHNPIVISESGNVEAAVESALSIQLYNQGQDCASPDAILVHASLYDEFLSKLKEKLCYVFCGPYSDKKNRIGPISNPKDLVRIQSILIENSEWIDPERPGTIHSKSAIVEPTIICKPLVYGGNYRELFAPIFFIQKYDRDQDLNLYFDNPHYAEHAMYISLFGDSNYISSLVGKEFNGHILHDAASIIKNSDPHAPGFERGTQPYGGYGFGTSSISYKGKITYKPTLPQREIFEYLIEPSLGMKARIKHVPAEFKIVYKNLEKFFGVSGKLNADQPCLTYSDVVYTDAKDLQIGEEPFLRLDAKNIHFLLEAKNTRYISQMSLESVLAVRDLRKKLNENLSAEDLKNLLYELPKREWLSSDENKNAQKNFFKDLYNLLFAKDYGPRLNTFLFFVEKERIDELLNI